MKNVYRITCAALAAVLLSACAGTNFKRPEPNTFTVGKTTRTDILSVMSRPQAEGEIVKNGQKVKTLRYAYAEAGGQGAYPGVTPARAIVFSTLNDIYVGEEFMSSFATDSTDFDEGKVTSIVKGKTTRAEVISMFGKPTGHAVYPFVKDPNESGLIYTYSHVKGTPFNMKFYSKALLVSLRPDGVVSDVEFTSSGDK